jgi:putative transposase
MKKTKFSDEKIAYILRQAEAGTPAIEVCRDGRPLGRSISEQTFYRWKKRFAGVGVGEESSIQRPFATVGAVVLNGFRT